MTIYGTGARRVEAAHLKVADIDSRRMIVHIHGGKGNRDRDVMLSPKLLDALRDYGEDSGAGRPSGSFLATHGTHPAVR